MTRRHIAVIDIGKTNAKLALVDLANLSEIALVTRPNRVLPGPPYPHFDTEGHWAFLLDGLAGFQARHGVDAISVTTHGACAVLLDRRGGLAAPVLDYEHDGPDAMAGAYDAIRPPFAETGSPRLPGGLNLGAQLHWLLETRPELQDDTATIVTYPQYWGHRLTGVAATDVTSLGCHTDLWNPHEGRFSGLIARLGITDRIAPARRSGDRLGPLRPEVAARTGLPATTPVCCGIHDSNASLLPHILTRNPPFSVVSSGTWTVCMAVGGGQPPLDPSRDVLVNVDALGNPVPSARFMGGREYDLAIAGHTTEPSQADLSALLASGTMLMPALVPGAGPFQGRQARWIGPEPAEGTPARAAAVALYLAMVTGHALSLIGHRGEIVVEGPFARNTAYLRMLHAATNSPVIATTSATGTSQGAALLVNAPGESPAPLRRHREAREDPLTQAMAAYHRAWQEALGLDDAP